MSGQRDSDSAFSDNRHKLPLGHRTRDGGCCRRRQTDSEKLLPREVTYEELNVVDEKRFQLLCSQACDGQYKMLMNLHASVFPSLIRAPEFWLSVCMYIVCRTFCLHGSLEAVNIGHFKALGSLAVLLVFMLNFYVNTTIHRFFESNKLCMQILHSMQNVSMLVRGLLNKTEEQREVARRVVDYLNAAHAFGYIGFSSGYYTTNGLWNGFNAEFGILTPEEESMLTCTSTPQGGVRYREAVQWAMNELHRCQDKGWVPPPILGGIYKEVLDFSNTIAALHDFKKQPIPFISEHMLVLFIQVYLPLQTFEMAMSTQIILESDPHGGEKSYSYTSQILIEIFGFVLAILANLCIQGLYWVGAYLEDPFGDNISDQSLTHFCRLAVFETRRILQSGHPADGLKPLELEAQQRAELLQQLSPATLKSTSQATGLRFLADLVSREAILEESRPAAIPASNKAKVGEPAGEKMKPDAESEAATTPSPSKAIVGEPAGEKRKADEAI